MGRFTIPEGTFFTHSPQIRVRCQKADDATVSETLENEGKIAMKGSSMNCFERPASDEERKGHEARLKGVVRMHMFLDRMKDKATVWYYGQVSMKVSLSYFEADDLAQGRGWVENIHSPMGACSMLAYNDKWSMISWDHKNLSRYGHRKRQEMSCVPQDFRGGNWYCHSGKREYNFSIKYTTLMIDTILSLHILRRR